MSKGKAKKVQKIKIFWIGDAVATTGFSRVNHSIITALPKHKYNIHQLGVNYMGDPHEFNYPIYPAVLGGDVYGLGRLKILLENIKPDIIFILNDPWIVHSYLRKIKELKFDDVPVVSYFPIDAEQHDPNWFEHYAEQVYATVTYTKFGKQVIWDTGAFKNESDIYVIPHGTDVSKFFPYKGKNEEAGWIRARKELYPYKENKGFLKSFIVLNANRNQPRKRIDITMRAFAEFAEGKEDVKLYCHMGTTDMGVSILTLAKRYNIDIKFIISSTTETIPSVPDERLNLIYNGCDVGINTSMGEGWGLTTWEHASTRKAQILPRNSVHNEIWGDDAIYIESSGERYMYDRINTLADIPSHSSTVEALETAYKYWQEGTLESYALAAYNLTQRPEYSWKNIALKFHKIFQDIVK